MVGFTGAAGSLPESGGWYEWSHVFVVVEDGEIVSWTTQFAANSLPSSGTDVEIAGFQVRLGALGYEHGFGPVGARQLTVAAGAEFQQLAGGFSLGGSLINRGLTTLAATTTVTGAVENDGQMTVSSFLLMKAAEGVARIGGTGDLRLRDGYLTGQGGEGTLTDLVNEGRISGHGHIGSAFGWAAFPVDAGHLVLTNAATGVITADVAEKALTISTQLTAADPVTNRGLISAANGGTLIFDGYNGAIDGSPLFVDQSDTGRLHAGDGSAVVLDDTVVTGGTLSGEGSGVIRLEGFFSRLVDLGIAAGTTVNMGRDAALTGAIANAGTMVADGFDNHTDIAGSGVTLSGGGDFVLVGNYGDSHILGEAEGAVLTVADQTIRGKGWIGGANLAVLNDGLISAQPDGYSTADTDGLTLDGLARLVNTGILEARGAATLQIVSIGGTVDNAAGIIRAEGAGAVAVLNAVTINGGVLSSGDGGRIVSGGSNVLLRGIATTATTLIDIGRSMAIEGAITNRGQIALTDFEAGLGIAAAGATLSGGGTVQLYDNYGTSKIVGQAEGAVLTLADGTIRGDGFIGGGNLTLVNRDLIHADADPYDGADSLLIADLARLVNTGALEARGGATLELRNPLSGMIENAGGTIRSVGAGSVVNLGNAVISGGKLVAEEGGGFLIENTTWDGRAKALTADLDMVLDNGRILHLAGVVSSAGDISFTYRSGVEIAADTVLTGGGRITINEGFEGSWILTNTAGTVLENRAQTFAGTGSFGRNSGLVLINGAKGVVTADQAGKELHVETGNTIRNNGVLRADGGILDIHDAVTGSGRLEVTGGGRLIVDQGTDQRVAFVGAGADTLVLSRRNGAAAGYDFAIGGFGPGDRIELDLGGGDGQTAAFDFAFRKGGVTLSTASFTDGTGQPHAIRLTGRYSEGQFELIGAETGLMGFELFASHNGGKRADRLDAAAKGERLIGFEGNDVLRSGKGHDVLDGSQGSDTADFSRATGGVKVTLTSSDMQKIGGGLGQDRLLWIENLSGSAYKDRLEGDAGANRLDGGGGADTLIGGGGNDSYVVDRAQDRVVEAVGGGTDTVLARATWKLRAGVEVEVLRAADRGETRKLDLTGNGFGQRIEGNDGANRIEGGGGKDTVKGYDGADTFVLSSAPGPGNRLTVLDFDAAEDRFLLAHDAFGLPRGPLAAGAFTANRAGLARDADDRIIHDTDSGRILFDTDGKGGAQAILIAQIGASPTLGAADFLVG